MKGTGVARPRPHCWCALRWDGESCGAAPGEAPGELGELPGWGRGWLSGRLLPLLGKRPLFGRLPLFAASCAPAPPLRHRAAPLPDPPAPVAPSLRPRPPVPNSRPPHGLLLFAPGPPGSGCSQHPVFPPCLPRPRSPLAVIRAPVAAGLLWDFAACGQGGERLGGVKGVGLGEAKPRGK